MFRFRCKTFSLLNNSAKICIEKLSCRAIIRVPATQFITASFYSKDVRNLSEIKSPLASLIDKDVTQRKQQLDEQEQNESKKNKEKSWRNMKFTLSIFGVSFALGGIYLLFELGKPKCDDEGTEIIDQYSNMPLIKQYILRTFGELDHYGQLLKEPSRDKLLPELINHPLYHPKYTLVLEFTDVIVHPDWTYNTGWRFKKRPGLDLFLETIHGVYEVVIYTAEQGMTVFPIVDAVDPRNLINYKLVRDATLFLNGRHLKDIDKLNRDLSKVIVVDWNCDCTHGHRDNVFCIPRWNGDDEDTALFNLSSFLIAISNNQIEDVREVLRSYNQYQDPLEVFRERQKKLIERAEQIAEEERTVTANQSAVSRWKPNFFRRTM